MKKSIILLSAAALVMFAACQKEEVAVSNLAFTASLEQQAGQTAAKSTLDGTTVKWVAGDAIKVFDNAGKGAKFIAQSAGTSSTFSEPSPAEREADFDEANLAYAIYPYTSAVSCTGNEITFNLPATQTYAENSFGQDTNVAVGVVNGTDIAFKNVCGTLALQLKGTFAVKSIELTGKNNEKLSGSFKTTVSDTPVISPDGETSEGNKKVTLNCETPVQLNLERDTTFYFIVPAGALASGFDAVIYDNFGTPHSTTVSTTSANTVNRSRIRRMPSKPVSILPAGYTEVEYVTISRAASTDHTRVGINTNTASKDVTSLSFTLKLEENTSKLTPVTTVQGTSPYLVISGSGWSIDGFSYGFMQKLSEKDTETASDLYNNLKKGTVFFELPDNWLSEAHKDYTISFGTWQDNSFSIRCSWYRFTMFNGLSVVKDFVPCVYDEKCGFFELVNNEFYQCKGIDKPAEGNYTAGNPIRLLD